VTEIQFPDGLRLETLRRNHRRTAFACGQEQVDDWLATRALQHQDKHLSTTKVLLDEDDAIAGFYTLATGQVDFGDLPDRVTKRLPRRTLPVAIFAWLGVDRRYQGQGLGRHLLAQGLGDCHAAGQTFSFVAVILDCLDDRAKAFYQQWDFQELPGRPYRLYLSSQSLEVMMKEH